jgi:hypothetical protein
MTGASNLTSLTRSFQPATIEWFSTNKVCRFAIEDVERFDYISVQRGKTLVSGKPVFLIQQTPLDLLDYF